MPAPDFLTVLDRPRAGGTALDDGERTLGYAELGPAVRELAGALTRHGVEPGDRVAVMLPNCVAAVELYLACAWLGAIWVGLNPAAPQAERDRQCRLVRPAVVVTGDGAPEPCAVGRVVAVAALNAERVPFDAAPPDPHVPCAIGFSSGTTGTPKAVVHSRAAVSLTAATLAAAQLRADDRVGIVLPMSIHNLMVVGPIQTLFAGATCVPVPRMNAAGVVAACQRHQLTRLTALVPTTIYDLVHDDTITGTELSTLRTAGTGAAGLVEELRSAFEEKFGVRLVGSYGMTEAPGPVCIEDPARPHVAGGSGRPLPHVRVQACDETGRPLPPGAEGELVVSAAESGPWAGLYRPALGTWTETGLQPRPDIVLRTGDRGWVDAHGEIHVTGRQADVIVRGGVNVNAAEIESVLGQLDEIRDLAVIGEPDDRLGQRIVAFVEPAPGAAPDPEQLRRRARGLLAHGKVPDEFVVTTLPRNAMGKVARGRLSRRRN
jgi:acyl-coenzyme A synthetase/AMP-(fatty) acid ligase